MAISLVAGVWFCANAAKHLRTIDPSCVVWDERHPQVMCLSQFIAKGSGQSVRDELCKVVHGYSPQGTNVDWLR